MIGAHFFHEGYTKWRDPKPFTGPFFAVAKGPFAKFFQEKVWDRQGLERLDKEQTFAMWGVGYTEKKGEFEVVGGGAYAQAMKQFGFDEAQDAELQQSLISHATAYDATLDDWANDIAEYRYGLERRETNEQDPARALPGFQKHEAKIQSELMSKRMPWQSAIDKIWKGLETDINRIATPEQQQAGGYLSLTRPGRTALDSEASDKIIPWMHMTIGVLLVIGLFTRLSALVAGAFLATVIVTQWPFTPGTVSTSYQQVEACACLVLLTIGAGRYLGLDGVLSGLFSRSPEQYEVETKTARLRRG